MAASPLRRTRPRRPGTPTRLTGLDPVCGTRAGPDASAGPVSIGRDGVALVANSNRGLVTGTGGTADQTVSVISTAAALAGRPASLGAIAAGQFPRDLFLAPAADEVYLGNYSSGTIEEFPVPPASLPRP